MEIDVCTLSVLNSVTNSIYKNGFSLVFMYSGQPVLSGHLAIPRGVSLKRGPDYSGWRMADGGWRMGDANGKMRMGNCG